jgi:hypothetical protein
MRMKTIVPIVKVGMVVIVVRNFTSVGRSIAASKEGMNVLAIDAGSGGGSGDGGAAAAPAPALPDCPSLPKSSSW